MRIAFVILITVALLACLACYIVGYRAGVKQSPLREERQGQVLYALGMYHAAEATNRTKVQSFLSTQIVAFTRDYERRFGVPSDALGRPHRSVPSFGKIGICPRLRSK